MRTLPLSVIALLAGALAAACDSPDGPDLQVPAELELLSGDDQQAVAGTELPDPLVVRVTDEKGKPVEGLVVNFRVVSGGGSVFAGSSATNADGQAQERWTLGTSTADSQRVEVRAVDAATGQAQVFATFRATALPDAPHAITAQGAAVRTGDAGVPLADSLAARVTDRYGNGVPGTVVVWSVTAGGGTVSPAQGTTNAQGVAKTLWTLGTRLDSVQTAEASIAPAVRAQFSATAGLPLGAQLTKASGDGQGATVGNALAAPLVVRLTLADGRPVVGATITWSLAPGAGSLTPPTSVTDGDGRAQTSWTLGTAAGQQGVVASVQSLTAIFTAAAAPGAPATFAKVAGDGQTAPAGTALDSLAVRVTDAYGNPVPGTVVSWSVLQGGGSVSPAQSAADADGVARARWTLGPQVNAVQSVRASVSGALVLQFNAAATVPSSAMLSVVSGNGQTATVGTQLPAPLVARLTLPDGRPVQGAAVAWTVVSGGGELTAATGVTDADGRTQATWTLGTGSGTQRVSAQVGSQAAVFEATAAAGAPATFAKAGGDGQTGPAGSPVADSLAVRVTDAHGNPVPGAPVGWSVLSGGGSVSTAQSTTDASGVARTRWTLGMRVDSIQSVTAEATPALRLQFNAMATVPSNASLVAVSGNGQTGPVGAQLPAPVVVKLQLPDGRGIAGAPVTLTAGTNSGTITPTSARTDANGQVSATWTMGRQAGAATATAGSPGVAPLALTATAAAGPPAGITIVSGNNQTGDAGVPMAAPLVVRVTDQFGNPAPGAAVSWTGSKPSTFTPNPSTTGAQGQAQTQWTPQQGGTQTARATLAATGQYVTFTVNWVAWRPSSVTVTPQVDTVLVGDSIVLSATVVGSVGQPLPNAPVEWTRWPEWSITITPAANQTAVVRGIRYTTEGATSFASARVESKSDTATVLVRRPRYAAALRGGICTLDSQNRVHCPGSGTELQFGGVPVAGEHAVGGGCAITPNGQLVCSSGVQPNPLGLAKLESSCALDGDGDAYCKGTNLTGELGNGTIDGQRFPMPNSYPYTTVVGGHKFQSITAGGNHRCALTAAGEAYCWGYDQMGQLGSSATTHTCQTSLNSGGDCHPAPLRVEGGLTFVQITAGEQHTCGLTAGGTVYCWGYNAYGQLGTGSFTGPDGCTTNPGAAGNIPCATAPVQVQAGGVQFKQIEAFGQTTCAIATDGRLFCWGYNGHGQLGTGDTTSRNVPTLVSGGLLFKDVSGGGTWNVGTRTSGLTIDGRLFQWGAGILVPTQLTGQI